MSAEAMLAAEFAALDQRLAILLAHEQAAGRDRSEDPLAGLAIRPSDAALALRRRGLPGPPLTPETVSAPAEPGPLRDLWATFGLNAFDCFVTVVALSVELDPRYRTVMAFLADDASAAGPTVGLAIRLWAGDGVAAARCRSAFAADGRLLGPGLINLDPPGVPLPFRTVRSGDWLADLALGRPALPAELRSWVTHHPGSGASAGCGAGGELSGVGRESGAHSAERVRR